nr:MAG TPA: hypothetical protein [Ackermannviridae sp.]
MKTNVLYIIKRCGIYYFPHLFLHVINIYFKLNLYEKIYQKKTP